MTTLGELIGCPEEEVESRLAMRQAMPNFGEPWAKDFDQLAAQCDDKAATCSLQDQPTFAFLRGQAASYRRVAKDIRGAAAALAALTEQFKELNQGEYNA